MSSKNPFIYNPFRKSPGTKESTDPQDPRKDEPRPKDDENNVHMFTKASEVIVQDSSLITAGRDVNMQYYGSSFTPGGQMRQYSYSGNSSRYTSTQTPNQKSRDPYSPPARYQPRTQTYDQSYSQSLTRPPPRGIPSEHDLVREIDGMTYKAGGNVSTRFEARGAVNISTTNSNFYTKKDYKSVTRGMSVHENISGSTIEAEGDIDISSIAGGGSWH